MTNTFPTHTHMGRDNALGISTSYGLDGSGIETWWGQDFLHPSRQVLGPPSLLNNGYLVFPGVRRPEHNVDHPPRYSVEVKERVELYLYSPYGPSLSVIG